MVDDKEYFYIKYHMRNEYDQAFGDEYHIECPEDIFLNAQEVLINDVIGTEYYYSNRGVWDQVHISLPLDEE
jgi:hypothetical protein